VIGISRLPEFLKAPSNQSIHILYEAIASLSQRFFPLHITRGEVD